MHGLINLDGLIMLLLAYDLTRFSFAGCMHGTMDCVVDRVSKPCAQYAYDPDQVMFCDDGFDTDFSHNNIKDSTCQITVLVMIISHDNEQRPTNIYQDIS